MGTDPDSRHRNSLSATAIKRPGGELQIAPYVFKCNFERSQL